MTMRLFGILTALVLASACKTERPNRATAPRRSFAGVPKLELLSASGIRVARRDSLEFRATTSLKRDTLIVRVALRNISPRTAPMKWGACTTSLQLYRNDSLSGNPVFDWKRRPNPDPDPVIGRWFCPAYLASDDLAAGDSLAPREFIERMSVLRIAGDSLAPGQYYLGTEVYFTDEATGESAELIRVPAGVIQIVR